MPPGGDADETNLLQRKNFESHFELKRSENVVKIDRVVLPAVQTSRFSQHLKLVGAERKKFLREISLTRKAQTYEL